jgi:hypothetical protein
VEDLRLDKFYACPPPSATSQSVPDRQAAQQEHQAIRCGADRGAGSERQQLPALSPDYRMALVPNPKWMSDDAKDHDQPAERGEVGGRLRRHHPAAGGPAMELRAGDGQRQQMNQAIKKMAGALSMFAPSAKTVVFKFNHPPS